MGAGLYLEFDLSSKEEP
ncbi:MAG: hypothetical protein DRP94_08510 [Candidatus Latescibacterota bacterium]|nr:MAG: hypothetical protein DRP94_08510 [Candidatus Latescibacterota bacterium]HDI00553.1 hypothetical protein [Bacillota bacterium]